MPETFESLLVKLSRAKVDYLVAGGVAVCLNGYVRTTHNLDLLVEGSPANIDRMLACLADFGDGSAGELGLEDFWLEEGAIRIVENFPIDLFTIMRGKTYADFVVGSRSLELPDGRVSFLAPEALIELKADSFRTKDLLDVATLRAILDGNGVEMEELGPWGDSTGQDGVQ